MDETEKRDPKKINFAIKSKRSFDKNKPTKEDASKTMSVWISATTLTLSILSIVLYSAGKAYRVAYLAEYGITDWNIPWSLQDLIYLGAISKLPVLILGPLTIFAALALFLTACILLDSATGHLKKFFPAKVVSRKTNDNNKNKPTQAQMKNREAFAKLFEVPMIAAAASIFIVIPCFIFVGFVELEGKKQAVAEKQAIFSDSNSKLIEQIPFAQITRRVQEKEITESGYLISCTEKVCGMFQVFNNAGKKYGRTKLIPLDGILDFSGQDIRK